MYHANNNRKRGGRGRKGYDWLEVARVRHSPKGEEDTCRRINRAGERRNGCCTFRVTCEKAKEKSDKESYVEARSGDPERTVFNYAQAAKRRASFFFFSVRPFDSSSRQAPTKKAPPPYAYELRLREPETRSTIDLPPFPH